MHKLLLNAVTLRLHLVPRTAFLIKADTKGANLLHPERPDLMAMRTRTPDGRETVFLPGSSIKGVVRSSAERILRTVARPERQSHAACDPLNHKLPCQSDASKLGDERGRDRGGDRLAHPMADVHRMLCLACRTFGSQAMAGRVRFRDALPTADSLEAANLTGERAGVSIDRRTGGPSRGKLYQSEVVTGGVFETTIDLQNVQLWQLGLVGLVLEDVDMGLSRLGSAKTRGLGVFQVLPQELRFRQVGTSASPSGIASLAPDLVGPYGLVEPDALADLPAGAEHRRTGGLLTEWTWFGESVWGMLRAAQGKPWDGLVRHVGGQA
jgi:CRISPR-associated RAMP protein (TIGR02581 family)